MKRYYIAWSSWFDCNKYDIEKIKTALKKAGCKNIRTIYQFGCSNQPKVVAFSFDENQSVELLPKYQVQETLGTEWIIIKEKDW